MGGGGDLGTSPNSRAMGPGARWKTAMAKRSTSAEYSEYSKVSTKKQSSFSNSTAWKVTFS